MRFKKTTWLNTKTNKPEYGIKIKYSNLQYLNVAENGKPLIFKTEKERDAKIAEIKKDPIARAFDDKYKTVYPPKCKLVCKEKWKKDEKAAAKHNKVACHDTYNRSIEEILECPDELSYYLNNKW
jgi:hypothetical protein